MTLAVAFAWALTVGLAYVAGKHQGVALMKRLMVEVFADSEEQLFRNLSKECARRGWSK